MHVSLSLSLPRGLGMYEKAAALAEEEHGCLASSSSLEVPPPGRARALGLSLGS